MVTPILIVIALPPFPFGFSSTGTQPPEFAPLAAKTTLVVMLVIGAVAVLFSTVLHGLEPAHRMSPPNFPATVLGGSPTTVLE